MVMPLELQPRQRGAVAWHSQCVVLRSHSPLHFRVRGDQTGALRCPLVDASPDETLYQNERMLAGEGVLCTMYFLVESSCTFLVRVQTRSRRFDGPAMGAAACFVLW
jgi:hypothetical protein